ncbi:MAG: nucleotide exchange factor GrpE [Patescibacteria group bacterium]
MDNPKQKKGSVKTTLGLSQDKKLEKLQKKCDEYLNGWKRAQADYQNLQKDTEKRMGEFRKYACEDMLQQILPLVDYFKHAFAAVPEDEKDSDWLTGIKHIQDYLYKFLEDNGIEIIKTVGEKFDPELHEAIKEEKSGEQPDSAMAEEPIILKETQSGFKLNGKVLVPAKVIISKK